MHNGSTATPKQRSWIQILDPVMGCLADEFREAWQKCKDTMGKLAIANHNLSTQNKRMRKALEEIRDENIKAFNNGCAEHWPEFFVRNIADIAAKALNEVQDASDENKEETQTRAQESGEQT